MSRAAIGAAIALFALSTSAVVAEGCSDGTNAENVDASDDAESCRCLPDGGVEGHGGCGKCPSYRDGASPEVTCYDSVAALAFRDPFSAPVAYQGKCTTTQIADFLGKCLGGGDGGVDAGDADGGDECQAFTDANAACSACLVGSPEADGGTADPSPVILPVDGLLGRQRIDLGGCIAAISAVDVTCKQNIDDLFACSSASCLGCQETIDDSAFIACRDYGESGASSCAMQYPVEDSCIAALNAISNVEAETECAVSVADFPTAFTIVATTMCGSSNPDE